MSDDQLLDGLNPAQRAAVEHGGGPLLILAGPGSGKTRVISHKVAYLIRVLGIYPNRIMAVTFTNKAARELKDRIARLLPQQSQSVLAGTFHSICARILRADGGRAGVDPSFVIYDDDDQIKVMKSCLADIRIDENKVSPRAVLSAISKRKAELQGPEDAPPARSFFEETVNKAYAAYEARLVDAKALDFDDLLLKTVRLFQASPETLDKYQRRYAHVLVDEFQDTNIVQYELVKMLAGGHRNLTVVGDPDQSIYRFRSADVRIIMNFERDFADATIVLLEENYRSTQNILDAAQGVIAANRNRKPKDLFTKNGAGAKIVVKELINEQDEASFVVAEIERRRQAGGAYRDFAVMYRTNAQSQTIEQRMVQNGVPYRLVGGTRFFERREVRDLIAYLRVVQNPNDWVSFSRIVNVPARGIGQKTVDDLSGAARASGDNEWTFLRRLRERDMEAEAALTPRAARALVEFATLVEEFILESTRLTLPELLIQIVERTSYREHLQPTSQEGAERWENVQQLASAAAAYVDIEPREALGRFLEEVALVSDVDSYDDTADAVTLITLHAAKGLEFPIVFILGMEDGILPHSRALLSVDGAENPEELEEERRLLYVGITRAKERLYLLRAFRRTMWGRSSGFPVSRFIEDIPAGVRTAPRDESAFPPRPKPSFLPARPPMAPLRSPDPTVQSVFSPGDRVRHASLGDGVVVSVAESRGDLEVTVAFTTPGSGVKKLLQSYARLIKIAKE